MGSPILVDCPAVLSVEEENGVIVVILGQHGTEYKIILDDEAARDIEHKISRVFFRRDERKRKIEWEKREQKQKEEEAEFARNDPSKADIYAVTIDIPYLTKAGVSKRVERSSRAKDIATYGNRLNCSIPLGATKIAITFRNNAIAKVTHDQIEQLTHGKFGGPVDPFKPEYLPNCRSVFITQRRTFRGKETTLDGKMYNAVEVSGKVLNLPVVEKAADLVIEFLKEEIPDG